jgi:hypothetical protein
MLPRRRLSLVLFFAAALVPFLVTLAFFVTSAAPSLLTDPQSYIAMLKRNGSATYMVSLPLWKHYLASDPLCRRAQAIVIGSSRVREIDHTLLGVPTCNLYVDGLAADGLARLADALPPTDDNAPSRSVYIGIDHFWLWAKPPDNSAIDLALLARAPGLWRAWRVAGTLTFFEWRDVVEAARRDRSRSAGRDDESSVWYADGHLYHPQYYARKRAGLHDVLTAAVVEDTTASLFAAGRIDTGQLQRIGDSVRLLHAKGYHVQAFWNPVSAEHIAIARRRYPSVFDGAIAAVDNLAATLPLDRYVPARVTLDATRFGCTDRDYFDPTHVDVDCMRRVFAAVFGSAASPRPPAVATNAAVARATASWKETHED